MAYPLKTDYQPGKGPCQLSASDLRTIGNMLNGLTVIIGGAGPSAEVTPPDQQGRGWALNIPGNDLPSNALSKQGSIIVTSADNDTAESIPSLWVKGSMVTGVVVDVNGTDRTIMLREVDVCINGEVKKMLVFASEVYTP